MTAPKIANPLQDTGQFLRQAGALALTIPSIPLLAADSLTGRKTGFTQNLLSMDLNAGKTADQTAAEASNAANDQEAQARIDNYNASLQENDIDSKTKQELAELYASGASSSDIANKLNAARSGKGIYAVRKLNSNEQSVFSSQPGRQQLMTLGQGSVLGV